MSARLALDLIEEVFDWLDANSGGLVPSWHWAPAQVLYDDVLKRLKAQATDELGEAGVPEQFTLMLASVKAAADQNRYIRRVTVEDGLLALWRLFDAQQSAVAE